MKKEELIEQLNHLEKNDDTESAHIQADDLLLSYINDSEIEEAYNKIYKWYA